MKRYDRISKWKLKEYVWCKCRIATYDRYIWEWVIYEKDDEIGVASNDATLTGGWYTIQDYKYSWCIYADWYDDETEDNTNYNRIEIEESDDLSKMAKNISTLWDYTNETTESVDKKYVVYVTGMSAPRKIHETLTEAQNEAKRLCWIEAKDVYVAELVDKYWIEIVKKDF